MKHSLHLLFLLCFLSTAYVSCGNAPDDPEPMPPIETTTTSTTTTTQPQPITPPLVPPATCSIVPRTSNAGGQFVNNPDNSRRTLKIIWPNRYTGRIVNVTVWSGPSVFDTLQRRLPNEYNDRERFYGTRPINDYPAPLVVGALLTDGNRVCVTLPDPRSRVDLRLHE